MHSAVGVEKLDRQVPAYQLINEMYKDGKRRIQGDFTLSPFFIDICTEIRYVQLSGREDRKQNTRVTEN